jgi:hypothetical protein
VDEDHADVFDVPGIATLGLTEIAIQTFTYVERPPSDRSGRRLSLSASRSCRDPRRRAARPPIHSAAAGL